MARKEVVPVKLLKETFGYDLVLLIGVIRIAAEVNEVRVHVSGGVLKKLLGGEFRAGLPAPRFPRLGRPGH